MFERFTDRARRVVVLAQEEARVLNHDFIGTEHILLGLIREGEGVGAKALESLGISLAAARNQVREIVGPRETSPSGHIPFTPRAKKALELSLREALELGHDYIGTEHILLGVISVADGVAAQVLTRQGVDVSRVRQQVMELLSSYPGPVSQVEGGIVTSGPPPVFRPAGISYVHIPAESPSRSAAFYAAVFGWTLRGNPEEPSFDDGTGHVSGRWVTDRPVSAEGGVTLYVYVNSLDETLARVDEHGGQLVREPYPEGDLWVATFRDPAGNLVGAWHHGPR